MTPKTPGRRVFLVAALFVAAFVLYGIFFYVSQQRILKSIIATKAESNQSYFKEKEAEEISRLNARAESICGTIAQLSAGQLENSQSFNLLKEGIAATLEPFMDYSEIAGIEVTDKDNRAYAAMWREGSAVRFRTNYALPGSFRAKYVGAVRKTATAEGKKQGTVTVYVDDHTISMAVARIKDEMQHSADAEMLTLRGHFNGKLIPQAAVLLFGIVFIVVSSRMVGKSYVLIEKQRRELEVFNRQLERRVEERTRELAEQFGKVSALNVGMQVEIKEREKAERKYRAIFENATEGIFQSSPTGEIISANLALARILGYASPEELRAVSANLFSQICTDAGQRQEALAGIQKNGFISQFESAGTRKDGASIWISISARLVTDAAGSTLFYEGTLRDVTRRRLAEAERQELQTRLVGISRQAGMAEVATGVLHNVGNVLNSVNVSTAVVSERIQQSRLPRLTQVADLIVSHKADLGDFLTNDERGRKVPQFLVDLSRHLSGETQAILDEMRTMSGHVDHIKQIVSTQQNYAGVSCVLETLDLRDQIDDALKIHAAVLEASDVQVVREYGEVPDVEGDRHKVLQIMVNLVSNAKHAMAGRSTKVLTVKTFVADDGAVKAVVQDTGCGIAPENLARIFSYGFTTKADGHGFGLHSSILASKDIKAELKVHSDGVGHGASFSLEFPAAKTAAEDGGVARHAVLV
ncbi:MAG TPA: PAS domain S-box protein [Tepidisphaeraceae bacterium]|jgi:PAS domain S-box-containing protein